MKKHFLIRVLIFLACFTIICGCKYNPANTLEIWFTQVNGNEKEILEKAIQSFNAVNPDIKVHLVMISDSEYENKLEEAIAMKETPDLFFSRAGVNIYEQKYRSSIMDLNRFFYQGFENDRLLQSYGKIWGIPLSNDASAVFYHVCLVSKNPVKAF